MVRDAGSTWAGVLVIPDELVPDSLLSVTNDFTVFTEEFVTITYQGQGPSFCHAGCPPMSPDAHSVRFSEMTAEAEAELAEWDRILHGRTP